MCLKNSQTPLYPLSPILQLTNFLMTFHLLPVACLLSSLVDTTPPVVTVSSGTITQAVELGTPGTTVFYTAPTATDNSGTALFVSSSAQPGDFFPVGQTVVTYTFQDPSGNPATGTFTVNVVEGKLTTVYSVCLAPFSANHVSASLKQNL